MPDKISFVKMHGLGNDFVIVDGIATPDLEIDNARAQALADRRHGIGADQVLLLKRNSQAQFDYRIWNADGNEVTQCGNGARSAYAFLRRRDYCSNSVTLRTAAGSIKVAAGPTGPRAYLGLPAFEPDHIPLARPTRCDRYQMTWNDTKLEFAAVAIGNPHAVFWVADVAAAPVATLGAALNDTPDFPAGVNVSYAKRTGPQTITLRVYERGVGETPACGSAAAACAVVAHTAEHNQFVITVPGGQLQAGWDGNNKAAWVEGKVNHVFDGTATWDNLSPPDNR